MVETQGRAGFEASGGGQASGPDAQHTTLGPSLAPADPRRPLLSIESYV